MRKLIAVFLMLLTFAVPATASFDPWQAVAKKGTDAAVRVLSSDGKCTGFVVDTVKKYVQSAAHCYSDEKIWVDNVLAVPIALDEEKDLMILEVKNLDPTKPSLRLAPKNPEIMQEVVSVGFGYGTPRVQVRSAKVSDNAFIMTGLNGPFIAVNVSFTPGQSGGPVLGINGEVVSIVQRGDGGTLGIGVGAETIRDSMGRFWSEK
jgi:serine protease Do